MGLELGGGLAAGGDHVVSTWTHSVVAGKVDSSSGIAPIFLHPREACQISVRPDIEVRISALGAAKAGKE